MSTPSKLYKYEPFTELTLRNLKRQSIYFSSPKTFNDPYDCAIDAEINDLSDQDMDAFRTHLLSKDKNTEETIAGITNFSNHELGELLKRIAREEITSQRENFIAKLGVTCLSEENDNLLMWSHYGGRYKGFCLEFDTNYEPFNKSIKVEYSHKMPKIDPVSLVLRDGKDQFIQLFCLKSKSWEYEREWRVMHTTAGTLYTYPPEALSGIYFGPDMEFECLEIIALILQNQNLNTKLYQGRRSNEFFKVEFSTPFTYTSFLDAKNLGITK